VRRSYLWVGVVVALVAGACTSGSDESPTVTPSATSPASASSSATAPPTSTAAATATPVVSDPIPGLFSEPRFEEPDASIALGIRPASVFPEHDQLSVVLYDTVLGTVREFGFGVRGTFSPDGRHLAWAERATDRTQPATLFVLDLETGAVSDLGEVQGIQRFPDARYLRIWIPGSPNVTVLVDVESGERWMLGEIEPPPLPDDRFTLAQSRPETSGESVYRVFERGALVLTIVALDAKMTGEDELLVLIDAGAGAGNIFIIDLGAVEATFVATTLTEPFRYSTIPLAANEDYVVWTPNACDFDYYQAVAAGAPAVFERRDGSAPEVGRTMVFDRATGTTTELADSSLWVAAITPDGRLVDGGFGGDALIDPVTLRWDVVLPGIDIVWSPDYRYASQGELLGHGGVCPTY